MKTHKKNLSIVLLVFLIAGAVSAQSSTGFHHRMNDSSGPVNDYLGFNNPGTAVNSPVFGASGVSKSQGDWDTGKGIKFNTLDKDSIKHSNADYVQMGDSSFTFATWFKISAGSNKIVSFLSKRNTNNNFKGYHFYAHQFANEFAFQLNDGAVTDFRVPYTIKEETLYHVVYSIDKDENNASVYLNGSYLGSKDISGIGSVNSTVDLLLGGNYDRPDYYMNGTLDETYLIKGDALNSSEVNTLYSKNSYDTGPTSTNTAPSVTNVNPSDGATDITDTDDLFHTDADISATIDDTDNSNLNVWFFNASNDEILYNENLVASGTTVQTQLENLSYGQTVDWYVKVSDGVTNTTSSTYSFTTFQPLGFFQQYRSAVDFNKTLVSSNALGSKAHNVVSYTQHAITTFNNSQYTAFLDTNGNLIAGKRSASGGSWNTQDTGFDCNDLTDPHHITSVGVTNDGIVHISYCHHNEPLNYITSDSAESISSFSSSSMTGTNENSVTYPRFLRTQDSLLFTYRNGVSGDGDRYLNEYDSSTSSWSALHHPWIQGGGESVYLDRLVEDDQGNLHVTWLWRGTGGADTNHNYSYAFSSDGGSTWESSTGNQYSIPITESEVEKFDPLDKQSGVLNSNDLTTDDYGNPHVAYFKKDSYGNINYYHAWNNGSQWKFNKITNMTEFSSGGYTYFEEDLARPAIFGNGDKVGVLMRGGQDHLIRYATATPPYENWKFESFTGLWGAMEFGYDRYAFQKNQSLEFLVQRVETSDGDQNELYSIQKNLEGFQEIEIIDSTPPTSSDNWTASGFVDQDSAIVELTATDTGGSGVADIYYRVNGGSYSVEQGSSASVTISSQGNNTLEYYAEDSAENVDATNTEYVALSSNEPPIARASFTKDGLTLNIQALASEDPDGSIESYEWDWTRDGTFEGSGQTSSHTYSSAGDYEIELQVTDDDGATDTLNDTISVTEPNSAPTASFTTTTNNLELGVDASGSSDSDGTISELAWDWTNDGNFETVKDESEKQGQFYNVEVISTSNGNKYLLNGTQQKNIDLEKGVNHTFNLTSSVQGHPFHISTSAIGGNFNGQITEGVSVTNPYNGNEHAADTGKLYYKPPVDESRDLYYQCGIHSYMGADISLSTHTLTDPTATHTYGSEGTYNVKLRVTDNDGATDTQVKTVSVSSGTDDGGDGGGGGGGTIDTTPPDTSDNWDVQGFLEKTQAAVSLSATDAGVGVDRIEYQINGNGFTSVSGNSASIDIFTEGNNTLEYYAVDNNGNEEQTQTEYVAFQTSTDDGGSGGDGGDGSQDTVSLQLDSPQGDIDKDGATEINQQFDTTADVNNSGTLELQISSESQTGFTAVDGKAIGINSDQSQQFSETLKVDYSNISDSKQVSEEISYRLEWQGDNGYSLASSVQKFRYINNIGGTGNNATGLFSGSVPSGLGVYLLLVLLLGVLALPLLIKVRLND